MSTGDLLREFAGFVVDVALYAFAFLAVALVLGAVSLFAQWLQ